MTGSSLEAKERDDEREEEGMKKIGERERNCRITFFPLFLHPKQHTTIPR